MRRSADPRPVRPMSSRLPGWVRASLLPAVAAKRGAVQTMSVQSLCHKLRERVDVVIMCTSGEYDALIDELLDPRVLGNLAAVWPRIRQPHIAGFDRRLGGPGARQLPTF